MVLQSRTHQRFPRHSKFPLGFALFIVAAVLVTSPAKRAMAAATHNKSFAQELVERIVAKHSELAGLGLSTILPNEHRCISIADTDVKEVGETCDRHELMVFRTGNPAVEKERDGYDVTLPLRVGGELIGIVAFDFRLEQRRANILERAKVIALEIESEIPSKSKLFESAK